MMRPDDKAGARARRWMGWTLLLMAVPALASTEDGAAASVPVPATATVPVTGDGPVVSTPLSLLVGELTLPFSYRVRYEAVSAGIGGTFSATQRIELVPVDGPRAGTPMEVYVRYMHSRIVPLHMVQGIAAEQAEGYANDARTRMIEPVQLEGFGMTAADTWGKLEGDLETRVVRLFGVVDGAMVNVFIPDPLESEGVSDLYAGIRGIALDPARIKRLPARLQAESARSTQGGQMVTVIGTLAPPEEYTPMVSSADVTRDGTGHMLRARQSFYLSKKSHSNSFVIACGLERPTDEAALALLRDPHAGDDSGVTVLSRGGGRIGTLATQRMDFIQDKTRTRKGSYRYAELGTGFVGLSLFHISGRPVHEHLEAELAKLDPACRPDSALLADPAPVAGDDAAPEAGTEAGAATESAKMADEDEDEADA